MIEAIQAWFKAQYDKLLAFVVLVGLLLSLFFLGLYAKNLKQEEASFLQNLKALTPRFPKATPPDRSLFEEGAARRHEPFHLTEWTNRLMSPEMRVRCVKCDRPIPFSDKVCPFPACKGPQPDDPVLGADRDKDGIPNDWESANGMNPLDPADAQADPDADGFNNLEEYLSNTKPNDKTSAPPIIAKLRVVTVKPIPFSLMFMGVTKMPSGKVVYQVNLRRGEKTHWKELGESVEGFKLLRYEPAERSPDGKVREVLTLEKDGNEIPLPKREPQPWSEWEAVLRFEMENRTFAVRKHAEFDLRGVKYRVKEIDTAGKRVLIVEPLSNKEVWVGQELQLAQEPPKEEAQEQPPPGQESP